MAATGYIWAYHGTAPGTTTEVKSTNVRHKRADNDTVDLLNPIPIPTSGVNYGWAKHEKAAWDPTPSSQISNLRWYAAATPGDWTGITLWAGVTAAYVEASSGQESAKVYGHMLDADNYPTGSPLTVESGVVLSNPSTGVGTQGFVIQQISLNSSTVSGVKGERQVYYRWDEI